jgi:hypothetical protein
MGYIVAWWLRHYATNLKVAGLRPEEVNEPFGPHYAPGFTQPLIEMSTRERIKNLFWGVQHGWCEDDNLTATC